MIKHMILPVTVVAIQTIAAYTPLHAGLGARRVVSATTSAPLAPRASANAGCCFKHTVRNALIPIVTIIAIDIGAMLGGLIITENIFNYPGMGVYFIDGATTATSRS